MEPGTWFGNGTGSQKLGTDVSCWIAGGLRVGVHSWVFAGAK